MGIPLDKANLLALFLENITYGVFLTVFTLLFIISLGERDNRIANQRFLLPVATLMMCLATTHLVINFVRALQAFVTGDPNKHPDPIPYYSSIANHLNVTKNAVYIIQTVIGDSVLVWRCYVIYNKKIYVLVAAGVNTLATLVCGIVIIWSFDVALPGTDIFETATHWIDAFFALTLSLNICCTGAIVTKVWTTQRTAGVSRSLFHVIAAIIESGAIYTTSVLGLLLAYVTQSNGQYTALDMITPLVGVTYCLIVLQIQFHVRMSTGSRKGVANKWSISRAWRRNPPDEVRDMNIPDSGYKPYPLQKGVAVRITEQVEMHSDRESHPKAIHFEDTFME